MPPTERDPADDDQAAAIYAAIQTWRTAHPQATLKEIEQHVDRQLAALRARWVTTTAVAGPVSGQPPPCPDCGAPMHWDGDRTRHLTTTHNEFIDLTRRYARCPACGSGLFPPG